MKRCLIVDGSDVVRKVALAILERMGHRPTAAGSAAAALEICRTDPPDVLFLDWQLDGMTGIEFLGQLRSLGLERRPYVIYWTTENDPIDLARAFTFGIDDYLLKPFTRDMLEAKLAEVPVRTEAAA